MDCKDRAPQDVGPCPAAHVIYLQKHLQDIGLPMKDDSGRLPTISFEYKDGHIISALFADVLAGAE